MYFRIGYVGCLISLLFLTSCIVRAPSDLTVDDVQKTTVQKAGIGPSEPLPGGSADVLKIDVATPTDLNKFAAGYGALVRFAVGFCRYGSGPRSAIDYPNQFTGAAGNLGDKTGIFHYELLVYASDGLVINGYRPGYDLSSYPRDICISVRGGNETGFGFHSNAAVALRAQIASALRTSRDN